MLLFVDSKKHVLTPEVRSGSSPGLNPRGLLLALLIAAVLLCHGILGFAHEVSCDACGPTEVAGVHHGSAAGAVESGGGNAGDDTSGGLEGLSYAAVVLAAFGAAALLGLLLGVRRWRETGVRRLVFRRHYPQVFALLPRGPTLPSLQVFRL